MQNVIDNAATLASSLIAKGYEVFTGGTDTHLLLLDLRPQGLTGADVEKCLERSGLTCNKNSLPFDTQKPTITSGVRFGSPAATSRGFGKAEFAQIADWIDAILQTLAANSAPRLEALELQIKAEVETLCQRFPIY
jgi:glycine hydroxymethyltransferase